MNSILIFCDNFWLGGRETFLADNIALLRSQGVKTVSLLAASIRNQQVPAIFDYWSEANPNEKASLDDWLSSADKLIEVSGAECVWVHHFSVSSGLLTAIQHKLPLHITIHGPLSFANYGTGEALAFTIATHRGCTTSAVSAEIKKEVSVLSEKINCNQILHNKVIVPEHPREPEIGARSKVIKFAVFSRQQKLDHLRQAVILFDGFRRRGLDVSLDIYTGITQDSDVNNQTGNKWRLLSRIFGRKWAIRNIGLVHSVKYINVHPITLEVPSKMQEVDIIFGMGRVVLEALANRKLAILVGYSEAINLITKENFKELQKSNFSGRSQLVTGHSDIISSTLEALSDTHEEREYLASLVDIENSWPTLKCIKNEIASSSTIAEIPQSLKSLIRSQFERIDEVPQTKLQKYLSKDELGALEQLYQIAAIND